MKLSREIYEAFESIVGKRNISDDPAVLDSYRTPLNQSQNHFGPYYRVSTPRGLAVIMPGSTEEVQGVVRLCNKYDIKFKASSTFWSSMGNISDDNAIQLDMRRMNHILEIDKNNRYAVIEPYIIGAELQAEAMRVGLNTTIIGAGASCSILAGTSSWAAAGPTGIFMGSLSESLMAAEWVMPDGEIIRTGSLGSGEGWFCGEGPGPSIRGMFRGGLGAAGAMGVCTKIAVRLSIWPGPPVLPSVGTGSSYQAALPDNIKAFTLCFPTWKDWANATNMLFRSEIAYLAHRQFNLFGRELKGAMLKILTDPTKSLADLETLVADPEVQEKTKEMKIEFQLIIAGFTKRDFEYKIKVLHKILEDTSGHIASLTEEPEIKNWMLLYLVRLGHKNLNFVYCGGYEGCFGLHGHLDFGASVVEAASDFKLEWEKNHTAIVNAGGDSAMLSISTVGGGGGGGWEFFTCFDSHDAESTAGAREFHANTNKFSLENKWGPCMGVQCTDARDPHGYAVTPDVQEPGLARSAQPHAFEYQWRIREAFNPNHLGDSYYRTLQPKA